MISKEKVKEIAKLAKISLTEREVEKFQKELSKILDYIETLKKVNVEGIEPLSHSLSFENIMRKDEFEKEFFFEFENLIEQFSDKKENFLKVKKIIQK